MTTPASIRVREIPRRVIRLAHHWPPTVQELEALWELGRLKVLARLYDGIDPQEMPGCALGGLIDSQVVGDRVVVTTEWIGDGVLPEEIWKLIGFRGAPGSRSAAAYAGAGRRTA